MLKINDEFKMSYGEVAYTYRCNVPKADERITLAMAIKCAAVSDDDKAENPFAKHKDVEGYLYFLPTDFVYGEEGKKQISYLPFVAHDDTAGLCYKAEIDGVQINLIKAMEMLDKVGYWIIEECAVKHEG